MISIGQKPDLGFQVKYAEKGTVRETIFSDLIKRPTLVSVFMRANTSSCDKQMVSLAEHQGAIQRANVNIIGVSRDTASALNRYALKHGIAFPLVSDPKFQFAEAVDSMVEKMYGKSFMGPTRSAYLFDKKGKLVGLIETVVSSNHGAEALKLVEQR